MIPPLRPHEARPSGQHPRLGDVVQDLEGRGFVCTTVGPASVTINSDPPMRVTVDPGDAAAHIVVEPDGDAVVAWQELLGLLPH